MLGGELLVLVLASQHHDVVDSYALVMQAVVLPLTVVTVGVYAYRSIRGRG